MGHKLKIQNKFAKILLLLMLMVIISTILVSCSDSSEKEKFIVDINLNNFTILQDKIDVYISAVNGVPTEDKFSSGTYNECDNLQITIDIENPSEGYDYIIKLKDGVPTIDTITYPKNTFFLVNLDRSYKLTVEVNTKVKEKDDSSEESTIPESQLCWYSVKFMAGTQSIAPSIRKFTRIGQTNTISLDNLSPNISDFTDYRFDYWEIQTERYKDQVTDQNKYNPNLLVTFDKPTKKDGTDDIIIIANYVKTVKTTYSKDVEIVSASNKHGVMIPNIEEYRTKTANGYYIKLVPGDKITLKYNKTIPPQFDDTYESLEEYEEQLKTTDFGRFNGWYKTGDTDVKSNNTTLNILISEYELDNNYYVNVIPQTLVSIKYNNREEKHFVDKGDNIYIENIPNNKMINELKVEGQSVQPVYSAINYNCIVDLSTTNKNFVKIEYTTKDAFTLFEYGLKDVGSFEIEKLVKNQLSAKTLQLSSTTPHIGWKVNDKEVNTLEKEYTLKPEDYETEDSLIKIEARYAPIYTNYSGYLTDGQVLGRNEYQNAFGNNPLYDKVNTSFFLPGMQESESLVIEGIYKDVYKNKYVLAGYVKTSKHNENLFIGKSLNRVLLVLDDRSDSTEENSNIESVIILHNEDGTNFDKDISSIAKLNDKLIISTYNDNILYEVPYDSLFNAGEIGNFQVKEFVRVAFDYITSLAVTNNMGATKLYVGGKLLENNLGSLFGPIGNGHSFVGEYEIKKFSEEESLMYHPSGILETQSSPNGYVPNLIYRLAKKSSPTMPSGIIQGISFASPSTAYIVMGADDSVGLIKNNEESELYKINIGVGKVVDTTYQGIEVRIRDLTKQTTPTSSSYKLPPLFRDLYVDNSYVNFISIGASYSRYIFPTDSMQCSSPVPTLIKIAQSNLQ